MASRRLFDGAQAEIGLVPIEAALAAITADLNVTLADATLAADGTITAPGITADLSVTLADATLAADGTVANGATGDLSVTLAPVTLVADGTLADGITGDLSTTLSAATLVADATLAAGASGDLSTTLDDATLAASGTVGTAGISGDLSVTLDAATLAASGTVVGGVTGALSVTLAGAYLTAEALDKPSGSGGTRVSRSLSKDRSFITYSPPKPVKQIEKPRARDEFFDGLRDAIQASIDAETRKKAEAKKLEAQRKKDDAEIVEILQKLFAAGVFDG